MIRMPWKSVRRPSAGFTNRPAHELTDASSTISPTQAGLLGELAERRVGGILAELDATAGQRPLSVRRGRGALRDAAQQDGVPVDAQRVRPDARHARDRLGHFVAYWSAPRK